MSELRRLPDVRRTEPATSFAFPPRFVPLPEERDQVETQCGPVDDSQPVEQYDGTLGVTRTFVDAHQAAVGQIQWNANLANQFQNPGNVAGERWCSGTLLSEDLFLTAGHCFDQDPGNWTVPRVNNTNDPISPAQIADSMHVNFNFQVDPQGTPRPEVEFPIGDLVERRRDGLDYAIVRLQGSPGRVFGFAPVSPRDVAVGDTICIIGHPLGNPKVIEAGPATDLHDTRIGYNDIDTMPGNSGSGILFSPVGTLVGVHTNGGCDPQARGHNHGQRVSSLLDASPTLRALFDGIDSVVDRVSLLRVHDVGSGFGPDDDRVDADVIVRLRNRPQEAFGFQLRTDADEVAREAMLALLRDVFNRNVPVRLEYQRVGLRQNRIVRVVSP